MSLALALLAGFAAALVWLTPFCIGLRLLTRGFHGVVNDHEPRCRACGYNLAGTSSFSRCSECGANLVGVGTVRYGSRRRPPMRIAGGAAMMTVTLTPAVLLGFQTATPSPAAAGGAKATTAAPVVQPVLLAANMAAPPSTAFSLEEMLRNRAPAVIRASLMCIDEQTVFARLVAPSGGNAAQQRCGGSPEGLPDPAAPLESPRADASPSITNRDPSVDALSMLPEHDRSAATFAAVTPLDLPMTYGRIPGYRAAASHADDWGKWKTTETFSGAMPRSDLVLTPSAQAGGFNRDDWTAGPSAIDAMPAGSVSQGPSPVRASRAVAVRERPLKP